MKQNKVKIQWDEKEYQLFREYMQSGKIDQWLRYVETKREAKEKLGNEAYQTGVVIGSVIASVPASAILLVVRIIVGIVVLVPFLILNWIFVPAAFPSWVSAGLVPDKLTLVQALKLAVFLASFASPYLMNSFWNEKKWKADPGKVAIDVALTISGSLLVGFALNYIYMRTVVDVFNVLVSQGLLPRELPIALMIEASLLSGILGLMKKAWATINLK